MRTFLSATGVACWFALTSWCTPLVNDNQKADPIAPQSDWDELQWSAMLSSAAYAGCIGKVHDVFVTHQLANRETSTQGFIGYSDQRKRIVVVFRGSDQPSDYLNDLDVRKVAITGLSGISFPSDVEIMRGILRPWTAVHQDVIAQVKNLTSLNPSYSIGITGHSLGGSITYLGFPVLAQVFKDKDIIAAPLNSFPIGNEAFTKYSASLFSKTGTFSRTRVLRRGTEHGDGVPNMYSQRLGPLLYHYGPEFYTNGTAQTTLHCEGERDMRCSAGDGAIGPNSNHHYSFGVGMGASGAMSCAMSGGSWGANGGSILKRGRNRIGREWQS